jgi:hypothetical protein
MENETLAAGPAGVPRSSGLEVVPAPVTSSISGDPRAVVRALGQDDLSLRLTQVEDRIVRVEAALDGLLRNNTSAVALLAQLVERLEPKNSIGKSKQG